VDLVDNQQMWRNPKISDGLEEGLGFRSPEELMGAV
jgi:hypothetical protein